jgi:hypothetical protein
MPVTVDARCAVAEARSPIRRPSGGSRQASALISDG